MQDFYHKYLQSNFNRGLNSSDSPIIDNLMQDFTCNLDSCTPAIANAAFNFVSEHLEFHTGYFSNILDIWRFALSTMRKYQLNVGQSADDLTQEALNLVALTLNLTAEEAMQMQQAQITLAEEVHIVINLAKRLFIKLPVAYATNQAWFCGKLYYVDNRVLIPRSPIEELINVAFEPFITEEKLPENILDMCTGSGCLGIASAHAFPLAKVTLSDISAPALEVAKLNIEKHNLSARVTTLQSDVWENFTAEKYDLIIANPPYVDTELYLAQAEEYKLEPKQALEAGLDGLDIARKILAKATDYLTEDGWLILEVGTSRQFLQDAYPQVPFIWIEFETGADGVLIMSADQLNEYSTYFNN